jgi:hypothetical protein
MVVLRLLYEFIIDSCTHIESPRHFRVAPIAVCGTVSKAFADDILLADNQNKAQQPLHHTELYLRKLDMSITNVHHFV